MLNFNFMFNIFFSTLNRWQKKTNHKLKSKLPPILFFFFQKCNIGCLPMGQLHLFFKIHFLKALSKLSSPNNFYFFLTRNKGQNRVWSRQNLDPLRNDIHGCLLWCGQTRESAFADWLKPSQRQGLVRSSQLLACFLSPEKCFSKLNNGIFG